MTTIYLIIILITLPIFVYYENRECDRKTAEYAKTTNKYAKTTNKLHVTQKKT